MARRTKAELDAAVASMFPDQSTGEITPERVRDYLLDLSDSSAAGVAGSDTLNEIRWTGAEWEAISSVTTQHQVVTREDTFDSVKRGILRGLEAGGTSHYDAGVPSYWTSTGGYNLLVIGAANSGGSNAPLDILWPAGEDPPFLWVLSPAHTGWNARMRAEITSQPDNTAQGSVTERDRTFGAMTYEVAINDVPFEINRYRIAVARPDPADADANRPNEEQVRIRYSYSSPPEPSATVVQIS